MAPAVILLCVTLFIRCFETTPGRERIFNNTDIEQFEHVLDIDHQRARYNNDIHSTLTDELSSNIRRDGHIVQQSTNSHQTFANGLISKDVGNTFSQERINADTSWSYGTEASSSVRDYNSNCIRATSSLTCTTIPARIPADVTTLNVTSQDTVIPDRSFQDRSFSRLSCLFLHGAGLFKFSDSSFIGLDGLVSLTLSGMDELSGISLQLAMSSDEVLPNLKNFALNPGQTFRSPFLKLEPKFLSKLAKNRLNAFNFSNIIFETKLTDVESFLLISNLTILNITGSFIIMDYSSKIAFTDIMHSPLRKPIVKVLDTSRLRTTNITDSMSQNSEYTYTYTNEQPCNGTHAIYPEFFLAEIWYANNIYPGVADFQGYCDLSSFSVFLKKMVFSGNKIIKLNITLLLPSNNKVYYLDISNNKLEYIGPGLFSTSFAMEHLILSNNELFHMDGKPEFEQLLTAMKNLLYVDITNNNISYIPPNMFRLNKKLRTLILANNRLTSIAFDLEQLKELVVLDIRGNLIVTLGDTELYKLQVLIRTRRSNISILFADNPIQCSCESVTFISWLVAHNEVTTGNIQCHYSGDSIDVDKHAVSKCEYLCKRTLIIIVSTVCSIVATLLLFSTIVAIRRFKTRQKKKNVGMLLRESLGAGQFMCFMAISGTDEDLVERLILENLRRLLKWKIGIDRDLVCTGTRFKPGFAICEEAYRLMKKCQVFVAVVSESFLRSQYCQLELQEACKQNKPTILIFHGHVDTEDMPQYMQEIFRRTSRAWIKQNDEGYYYVIPNLIDMSEAIWDLAISDLLHKM